MELILLDLDKTLIDEHYRLTTGAEKVRSAVGKLRAKDIYVGLCSDSSLLTLRQWADRLDLTGPLIAERGAMVGGTFCGASTPVDPERTGWFNALRDAFLASVPDAIPGVTVLLGDATQMVEQGMRIATPNTEVLLVNEFRSASFSFFARRSEADCTELVRAPDLLRRAEALASNLLTTMGKSRRDLFWDANLRYGILIVHARSTTKSNGIRFLRQRFAFKRIVMFGDQMSDFVDMPDVEQFAVGNASAEYKRRCCFVAKSPCAEGVLEGLEYLIGR